MLDIQTLTKPACDNQKIRVIFNTVAYRYYERHDVSDATQQKVQRNINAELPVIIVVRHDKSFT